MSEAAHMPVAYRVLVADDTLANRTLVKAYLTRLGFEVLLAENGQQAVECFERETVDIILMDVMMPMMDGLEATREIRRRAQGTWVPIVMLSALGTDADVVSGLDTGADDYLVKPLSYQIFAAKMRTVARTLSLQRQTEHALAQVQAISGAMSDGMLSYDVHGRILTVNAALARLFGRRATDFTGAPLAAFFGEAVARALQDAAGSSRSGVMELEIAGPDEDLLFEAAVSSLPDARGEHSCIAVLREVTTRKRAEQDLAVKTEALQRYHDEAERENLLALQILERQVRRGGLADAAIQHRVMPAERFSGDLILAERAPDGRLFCMLADATGHGLAAAVSVLPAVSEFYRRVALSPDLAELVAGLSVALHESMPVGRFVAAALACVDSARGVAEVWVGGTPDVLHLAADGRVAARFASHELPLGIEALAREDVSFHSVPIAAGEALAFFSDGLLEAPSPEGESLGYARVAATLGAAPHAERLAALEQAIGAHCRGALPHDDLSILLVTA